MILDWFSKPEYHQCFSTPCIIISDDGTIQKVNKDFFERFGDMRGKKISSISSMKYYRSQMICEIENSQWELNYFKTSAKQYHVLFIPYDSTSHMLSQIPSPVAVVGEKGNIISANDSFRGYTPKDKKIKNLNQFFDFSSSMLRKKLNVEDVLWNGIPMEVHFKKGTCSTWIVGLQDKTEIQKIKKQMQKSQHLQNLGQLVGSISHDFNNIFTSIKGLCELLHQSVTEDSVKSDVSEIISNIDNATGLAKELIKFASQKDKAICNPYNTIIECKRLFENISADINVSFDIKQSDALIKISSCSLQRILMNLVINSRDSIKENGEIKISLLEKDLYEKHIKKNVIPSGKYVILSIEDNGSGIPLEIQDKIFSPFFSTKDSGTGLGLSNVISIVENGDGYLDLKSNPNGTSVTLYFPINQKNTKKTVLLIEDEDGIRQIMKKSLERKDYEVISATNGAEGIDIISSDQHIDTVITDAVMHGKKGTEVLEYIKENKPNIKTILMSGYPETQFEKNFDNFLPKPFSISQLVDMVSNL
ncbi:PAS domain-containing sensor histidine kinase [Candidatus Nesciobacter abundans]|uniref:histidine kinase n=1 Tax=Candidatus Nesciobacter abundans TaxID=2601668 RepID=A0A5C0UFK9_9PROT|nr:PAS domain-containing sensor histidine kinase [Candidatus Nesciobacter abundans]QEK38886.1 response regulator [Candidatus Nesciobacter abundans]